MTGDPTKTRAGGPLLARRYRLLTQVGRGGMGTVWQAHDEVLGRDVAVKEVILPHGLSDDDRSVQYKRTFREARTAARLGHPGVVAVYDVVEEDGRPWIIMELIKARSLDQVIKHDGPLEPLRAADIGRQMLAALHAAHSAGVLHRDVKPSNVLLATGDRAVLTDFGIAIAEGDATLTQTGLVMGSPAYIAPERARGKTAGPASDLWSLGVTLYAMVHGRSPFERSEPMAALVAIISEDPAPPIEAGPLAPIIDGLLRKNPDERMNAHEAGLLLDEILMEESENALTTVPVSPPPATGDPAPNRTVVEPQDRPEDGPADHTADDDENHGVENHGVENHGVESHDHVDHDDHADHDDDHHDDRQTGDSVGDVTPAGVTRADVTRSGSSADSADSADPAGATVIDRAVRAAAGAEPVDTLGEAPTTVASLPQSTRTVESGSAYGPPPFAEGTGGEREPGRNRTGLIVLAVVVAALLALGMFALLQQRGEAEKGAARSGATVSSAPQGAAKSPAASASSAPAPASQPASPPTAEVTPAPARLTVPDDFRLHEDSSGFKIAIPKDWSGPERKTGGTFFYSPDRGTYLQVDYAPDANPSALKDWQKYEKTASSNYSGYKLIKIAPVTEGEPLTDPTGADAADWEFSHQGSRGRVHVLNRGLVMNGHGYALLLSAPDDGWSETWQRMQPSYASFVPAD